MVEGIELKIEADMSVGRNGRMEMNLERLCKLYTIVHYEDLCNNLGD